jgi:hypothetical protein
LDWALVQKLLRIEGTIAVTLLVFQKGKCKVILRWGGLPFSNFVHLPFRKYNKMIEIGKYNTLIILRDTKVGLFLGTPETDPEGIHDILLPNKYVPNEFEIGEELIVLFI